MKRSKTVVKQSFLGFIALNILLGTVAYGANPGSIGALFKYNEPSYANVWIYPGDNIQDNTIDSSELEANSVGASELADNSVGTDNVIDNSLTATDLAPNSIGNSELSNTENLTINNIHRSGHNTGHLVGSYNSVGSNATMSNPIYSIGSSYMPGTNVLNDFYGIGYSHTNATFIPPAVPAGWGQYIASDGDVRHFMNGSNGAYWNTGGIKVDNRTIVGSDGWTEGDNIRQNSIDSSEIQDNTITASDLAANSVGGNELANNSVTNIQIADNSILSIDIKDNTLTASDLAPDSVGNSELIDSPAFTNPTGMVPTANSHLTTKAYVDGVVSASSGQSFGNQAGSYFSVGGDPYFCKRKTISVSGRMSTSSINNGATSSPGKFCKDGTEYVIANYTSYTVANTPNRFIWNGRRYPNTGLINANRLCIEAGDSSAFLYTTRTFHDVITDCDIFSWNGSIWDNHNYSGYCRVYTSKDVIATLYCNP